MNVDFGPRSFEAGAGDVQLVAIFQYESHPMSTSTGVLAAFFLGEADLSGSSDSFMNLAKQGYAAYEASQSDVSKTGGSEYNSPDNRPQGVSRPSFNHDEVVQTAEQHGSGDSGMFSHAMNYVKSNTGTTGSSSSSRILDLDLWQEHEEPIDEEHVTNSHQEAYERGNAGSLSAWAALLRCRNFPYPDRSTTTDHQMPATQLPPQGQQGRITHHQEGQQGQIQKPPPPPPPLTFDGFPAPVLDSWLTSLTTPSSQSISQSQSQGFALEKDLGNQSIDPLFFGFPHPVIRSSDASSSPESHSSDSFSFKDASDASFVYLNTNANANADKTNNTFPDFPPPNLPTLPDLSSLPDLLPRLPHIPSHVRVVRHV
ncbi:hypothetical protein C8J55DRAFT_487993 [Lentinula edodes]|uniref:DUF7721 domain-containing protein n=1 Tax=Lentinula lateritia TaxID=40482 RepID=A0A9W9AMR9_9AGAR|nr:hypothetical protein C8J55DRAFT_487993 [Lentinula edodes]